MARKERQRLQKVETNEPAQPTVRRKTAGVVAGAVLLGSAASGCQLFEQPAVKGKNVFIVGDSLTNRMNAYGNLEGQLKAAGFNVVFDHGYEGQPLALTQTLMSDPTIQADMKKADFIINGMGTNPLDQHVDPGAFYNQVISVNAEEQSINPNARRYMYDLATSFPGLTGEFSIRNQMIFKAAANPEHGFDIVRRYEALYHGDAQNESPYLHYAPIDADTVAHVHDQTVAGWQREAAIVVASLEYGQHESVTWLNPQYQGNGTGDLALGALKMMLTPADERGYSLAS